MKQRDKYFAALHQPTVSKLKRTGPLWYWEVHDSFGLPTYEGFGFTRRHAENRAKNALRKALKIYEQRLRELLTEEW